jgi:tetratricopeptide (TPR) repeat protein
MSESGIFKAAVKLPPERRAAYLDQACGPDAELRAEVESLLRAHDATSGFLEHVPAGPDPTEDYRPIAERPGTVIAGRYKLLEEIGQGGMGTVWAAEQTTPVRRKVALKLIKAGMDSRSVLARFEAERQALALMDHPNIAKVLDGGITESGRPYFVMEYVKGVPITQYCDTVRLSVEERLDLFIQVCSALQHAHQKGIIHRDLKPSNILVAPYDDKPVPKVIDFGLAKAMYQSLTEKTLYTAHETVLGTPLYMSPEQAQLNNLDVDTRSDIYSLGVLLYELLTGTTPLERKRFQEAAWDEVRRMIREEEPPRPSTRLSTTDTLPSLAVYRQTDPARLKKLVRGELDWIVMKALEKDRTRRYETANGLARDIQRYLGDEVVEARPPSTGYRLGKFVRRHRAQVIAAGLILLALLAGIAGTTWGLIREARARTRLAESLERERKANTDLSAANAKVQARYDLAVDAIKTFHTGVSEDFLLKEEQFKDLRNRLLKSAQDFYRKLSTLLGKETDLESRRALAQSNFDLADLTNKVGLTQLALKMHQDVLAIRAGLASESTADAGLETEVGWSLIAIASLQQMNSDWGEAMATYRRAEVLLAGLSGTMPLARSALADARSRMGYLLFRTGKTEEALAACRLARADQETLAAAPDAPRSARLQLAETISRIAFLSLYYSRVELAEADFRAALEICRREAEENPGDVSARAGLAFGLERLATALSYTGKLAEAEADFRSARAILRKLADDNPAVTQFRVNFARCSYLLAWLLTETGGLAEAEQLAREAIAINRAVVEEGSGRSAYRMNLAQGRDWLSAVLLDLGRAGEAEAECRAGVEMMERVISAIPESMTSRNRLPIALFNLGDAIRAQGRAAEACAIYERAVALTDPPAREKPADPEYVVKLVSALWRRGLVRRDQSDLSGAAADLRRAVALGNGLPPRTTVYFLERVYAHAVLSSLAGRDGSGVEQAEAANHADLAMRCLTRAVAVGYGNVKHLRIESALDPLRDRADFKKLMAELEKNSPPPPDKK